MERLTGRSRPQSQPRKVSLPNTGTFFYGLRSPKNWSLHTFSPFSVGVRDLINQGALHEVCYMSSTGEIISMEIAVGARSPLAPTAAMPYTAMAVAKLAPAGVTY